MNTESRLKEAIKQINIAIEETDQSDIIRELEDGKESIQKGQELLAKKKV